MRKPIVMSDCHDGFVNRAINAGKPTAAGKKISTGIAMSQLSMKIPANLRPIPAS